jgi:hypothetical protein
VESQRKKQTKIRLVAGSEGLTESDDVYGSGVHWFSDVVREGWIWQEANTGFRGARRRYRPRPLEGKFPNIPN